MGLIHICFNFNVSLNATSEDYFYSSCTRPLVKFLYAHPNFKFAFSFTGPQLSFYNKKKKEVISILKEFISNKQIEIIGSGYYNPILPLLNSADRNAQIDKFTTEARQVLGRRPRGIFLFNDIWDSSLVNNLHTCGIDYITLDHSLIPEHKRCFLPIIMSDLGKYTQIYPTYNLSDFYTYESPEKISCDDFISSFISKVASAIRKDDFYQSSPDRIVFINLCAQELSDLINAKFFEAFDSYITEKPEANIVTSIPMHYEKADKILVPSYISSGVNKKLFDLPQTKNRAKILKNNCNLNIYDVLEYYPAAKILNSRLLYQSNLINLYKEDKIKKKIAREKLYQAQSGQYLLCPKECFGTEFNLRSQSYKLLGEVEEILHEDPKLCESINCFDYDGDGLEEYVCRMKNFYAFISKLGGAVGELELYKPSINYCDNNSRPLDYDGFEDKYKRGFFIDHLLSAEEFATYTENASSLEGVFSKIRYTEIKFSQSKFEIHLKANAVLTSTKQRVSLIKKYIINSTGMYVQYFIRNESKSPIKAKFVVESTFCNSELDNYYEIETATVTKINYFNSHTKKILNDLTAVRFSDIKNGVSFVFEPNEKCGAFVSPVSYKAPDCKGNLKEVQKSTVHSLIWDVNLESGMETEKNFNFTIIPVKKNKKK